MRTWVDPLRHAGTALAHCKESQGGGAATRVPGARRGVGYRGVVKERTRRPRWARGLEVGIIVWLALDIACHGGGETEFGRAIGEHPTRDGEEAAAAGAGGLGEPSTSAPGAPAGDGASADEVRRLVRAIVEAPAPERSPLEAAVRAGLESQCGDCHGPGSELEPRDIADPSTLIARGWLLSGSGLLSFDERRAHAAPNQSEVLTAANRALVERFSSRLPGDVWPRVRRGLAGESVDPDCSPIEGLENLSGEVEAMLSDLRQQPEQDRRFQRYFSVAFSGEGRCEEERAKAAGLLFGTINTVSTSPTVVFPQPAGPGLYRIDLRDYGWNRPMDLDGDGAPELPDGWAALVDAASPHVVKLEGGAADALAAETGSPTAWMPAESFVLALARADVYYALTDTPPTVAELEQRLGIDLAQRVAEGTVERAAHRATEDPRRVRFLVHVVLAEGRLGYWRLDEGIDPSEAALSQPLAVPGGPGEAIYDLPNALPAYLRFDDRGRRVAGRERPVPRGEPSATDPVPLSCVNCHGVGAAPLLPFDDEVRPLAEASDGPYDEATRNEVLRQYPSAEQLGASLGSSSLQRRFDRGDLIPLVDPPDELRGASPSGDGFSLYARHTHRELTQARMAAELRVSEAVLTSAMARSLTLPSDRKSFEAVYLEAFCRLHAGETIRPVDCR